MAMKQFLSLAFFILQTSFNPVTAGYDEPTAISLVHFAAASFVGPSDPNLKNITQQCFQKAYPDTKTPWVLDLSYSITDCSLGSDTCQGLIASNEELKTIVFAFRGTVGLSQLYNEAKKSLYNFTSYDVTTNNGIVTLGRADRYFYDAMNNIWSVVSPYMTKNPGYKIKFTGHSLGGAIAALSALNARSLGLVPDDLLELYTFGEPRIGDSDLAASMKTAITNQFRLVHSRDPVPHMPFCNQTGDGCYLTPGKPYHHPQEIWYHTPNKKMDPGTYKLCNPTMGEDTDCSDSIADAQFFLDTIDFNGGDFHNNYFNHRLDKWGPAGCSNSNYIQISSVFLLIALVGKWFL